MPEEKTTSLGCQIGLISSVVIIIISVVAVAAARSCSREADSSGARSSRGRREKPSGVHRSTPRRSAPRSPVAKSKNSGGSYLDKLITNLEDKSGRSAASTPKELFETIRQAVIRGDWGTVWNNTSKRYRDSFARKLRGSSHRDDIKRFGLDRESLLKMPDRQAFIAMFGAAAKRSRISLSALAGAARLVDFKVSGDRATLDIFSRGKKRQNTVTREDGAWKLTDEVFDYF